MSFQNLRELLEGRASATPEKVFLFSEADGRRFTYAGFDAAVNRAAQMLRAREGVRKGDVVSLRGKARQMIQVQWNRDVLSRTPPPWLDSENEGLSVKVREYPLREHIDVPVREQLIVELYSK